MSPYSAPDIDRKPGFLDISFECVVSVQAPYVETETVQNLLRAITPFHSHSKKAITVNYIILSNTFGVLRKLVSP